MNSHDLDKLFDAVKSGNREEMSKVGNAAAANLSEEQKSKIEKALSDPDYLQSVLSTPKAQEILRKLKGGEY